MGRKVSAPAFVNPYEKDTPGKNAASSGHKGQGKVINAASHSHEATRGCEVTKMLQSSSSLPLSPRFQMSTFGRPLKSALKRPTKQLLPAQARPEQSLVSGLLKVDRDSVRLQKHDTPRGVKLGNNDVSLYDTRKPCSVPAAQLTFCASQSYQQPVSKNTSRTCDGDVDKNACGRSVTFQTLPPPAAMDTLSLDEGTEPKNFRLVAESGFTQQNPFRVQTFEAFCSSPDYGVSPECCMDQEDLQTWMTFPRATEGVYFDRYLQKMSAGGVPNSPVYISNSVDSAFLKMMEAGDWFFKWTRRGSVHQRYLWLDARRGLLMWGPKKQTSFFLLSQVCLSDVLNLRPDCMHDEKTGRTFYRFFVVTEERGFVFATELRDKFDTWYNALKGITLLSDNAQLRGLLDMSVASALRNTLPARIGSSGVILHGQGSSTVATANNVSALDRRGRVLSSD